MAGPEKREKYAYLDQLSTERLQELLRADLESDSTEDHSEVIFHILEVMEQREKENPTGQLVDVSHALEEFQAFYNIPEGEGCSLYPECSEANTAYSQASADHSVSASRHYRLRRVFRACITVAATVALLFTILVGAQASGIDVFGALARWTESAFSFGPIQSGQGVETQSAAGQEVNISSDPSELPTEYQELWTELKGLGINSLMFPTYIPDGFQVEENDLYLQPESNLLDFHVWYKNENDNVILSILYDTEPSRLYEKDQQDVEPYESMGNEYYIFSNNGENVAAWYKDGLEYSLSTTTSVSELKTILDSMYLGVVKNEI